MASPDEMLGYSPKRNQSPDELFGGSAGQGPQTTVGIGEQPQYLGSPEQTTGEKVWGAAAAPFQGLSYLANKLTQSDVDHVRMRNGESREQVMRYPTSQLESESGAERAANPAVTQSVRLAPLATANPWVAAPLSAGAEAFAQTLENPNAPLNKLQVGLAGAIPGAPAFYRAGRAAYRTGERLIPSLFQRSQRQAQAAGDQLVEGLRPTMNVDQLMTNARATGDVIPTPNTAAKIAKLDREIVENPTFGPDILARKQILNLQGKAPGGGGVNQLSVNDILSNLADIGPAVSKGPRSRALYGVLLDDLETAAAAGGPGAAMAREGLNQGRRNLGVVRLQELLGQPPVKTTTSIGGGNVDALNISELRKGIMKDPDLQRWLGPDGLKALDEYIATYHALPPQMAYNAMRGMVTGLGGLIGWKVGAASGHPIRDTLVGVLGPEFATNFAAAGPNSALANRRLQALNQFLQYVRTSGANAENKGYPYFRNEREVERQPNDNDPLGIR